MRPTIEPLIVVQEKLTVADDTLSHKHEQCARLEQPEARFVDRSSLIAFVERPEQDSILLVGWNRKLLLDVVKENPCTVSRQIGEDHDDYLVIRAVSINGWSAQELRLVSAHELDHIRHAAAGAVFRSEPKNFSPQAFGHEGADRPIAAEILVRLCDETFHPFRDGTKR